MMSLGQWAFITHRQQATASTPSTEAIRQAHRMSRACRVVVMAAIAMTAASCHHFAGQHDAAKAWKQIGEHLLQTQAPDADAA